MLESFIMQQRTSGGNKYTPGNEGRGKRWEMQWEHIRNNNTTKFKFTTKYIKNKTGNNIETETKEIKFDTESTFEEP